MFIQSLPVVLTILMVVVVIILLLYIVNTFFSFVISHILKKTASTLDDNIALLIKKVLMVSIVLIGAYYISLQYELSTNLSIFLKRLFLSGLVTVATTFLLAIVRIAFREIERRHIPVKNKDLYSIVPFMHSVSSLVIMTVGGLIVLWLLGVNVTPALASAGIIGVAVAFAAKDLVANLFGGLSVFFDKPYKIGDYVIIDKEYRGEVVHIGMRSTKIRTRDGIMLTVPNSVMVTQAIINETGNDGLLRVRIGFEVSYKSNLEEVENLLLALGKSFSKIRKSPEPRVRYREFTSNGIRLEFLVVIKDPATRGKIMHELIKEIHVKLSEHSIEIPFTQIDVKIPQ